MCTDDILVKLANYRCPIFHSHKWLLSWGIVGKFVTWLSANSLSLSISMGTKRYGEKKTKYRYIYSWNWNSPPKTGTSWLWGSWEMGSSRRISLRMAKWILMVLPNSFASWWVRVPQGGRTVSEKEKVKVLKVSKWRDSNSFVTLGYCVNIIYIYILFKYTHIYQIGVYLHIFI